MLSLTLILSWTIIGGMVYSLYGMSFDVLTIQLNILDSYSNASSCLEPML